MSQQMPQLMLTIRRQSCRSSLTFTSTSSSSTTPRFPSLSIHCLRLQARRTYASKPKPSRKPHQPSPQSRHPSPIAPVHPHIKTLPSSKPTSPARTTPPLSHDTTSTSSTPTSSTLLYLAPSLTTHTLSSLTIATFCTSYGLYNFYDAFLVPHPGLWIAVPYMMGGVSVFMCGVGVWVGLGARRLVGSLSLLRRAGGAAGGEVRGGGGGVGDTMIRLEPKRLLPFLPQPASIDIPASSVQLSTRLRPLILSSNSPSTTSSLSGPLPRRNSPNRRSAVEKRDADRTLGAVLAQPFTNGLRSLSRSIGRLVGREGFATVWVDGRAWRVDVRGGWFAEDGGAMDRVLRVR